MKVTKTYRRYEPEKSFGIVTSPQPKVVYLKHSNSAHYCVCGAAEKVLIWNLNTAETAFILERDAGLEAVSCLTTSESEKSDNFRVGVGYMDGWVHIFHVHFDTMEAELEAHFRAGKSRVSCLDMKNETFVCAADAAINIFDMVSGCGSKLKGHRGLISCVALVNNGLVLISSAQDTFIKFWNVKNLHCFATLTGHPGPVWDFSLAAENRLLISGSGDSHLRLWNLKHFDPDELCSELMPSEKHSTEVSSGPLIAPLSERQSCIQAEFVGSIPRFGSRRVHSLIFDQTGMFLFCQSFDRTLEVFRLLDEDAKTKRLRKKIKKMRDKGEPTAEVKLEASDLIRPIIRLILPTKPASCDVLAARPVWQNGVVDCFHVRFIVALMNNCLEEVDVIVPCTCVTLKPQLLRLSVNKTVGSKGIGVRVLNRIHASGHRSAPIACCLTSDGRGIFTLSRTEAKLWSRYSTACLATLTWSSADTQPTDDEADDPDTEHVVQTLPSKASAFVLAPGDRHVVVGFESGHLLLFDVHSKSIRQTIPDRHQGAVRALALTGDQKSIISGGSDKRVTFYNFDLKMSASKPPTLCLVEARAPETVADQITCLAVSPNNRLVVIGLVNFHVDVYFLDSFKV
ncbi:hypothetical protein EG68_09346 [Paragonimus skrjabini miyazakii]|uniref:Uncharacterized protein n=1 Tax=Paragonimus skrjabini miyazakii TaxID=59628 RepID=A0A8S9YPT7_9TREM|nr:hypothetical protein EG68_09346 [Paragonimus skrjabini miyazakii]